MAESSQMLVHGGMAKRDWFSDKLLVCLEECLENKKNFINKKLTCLMR